MKKSANAALADKQIDTFLPIKKVVSHWKDRKKEIDIPLFPGYLLVNSSLKNRLKILNARSAIRILGINGHPTPMPNGQIESIKRLLDTSLYFAYLTEGTEVIVVKGHLEGMRGKIIERRGEGRLILTVDLIKRSITVEVDITDVELNQ